MITYVSTQSKIKVLLCRNLQFSVESPELKQEFVESMQRWNQKLFYLCLFREIQDHKALLVKTAPQVFVASLEREVYPAPR